MPSRREFVRQLGGAAITAALPLRELLAMRDTMSSPADIQFGYASITWEGNDRQAIEDISALGFPGIQLRSNVLAQFGSRPGELRDLLAQHGLTFVALSSGNVRLDPATEAATIDEHVAHARFLRDAGGHYLQLIDERPKGRAIQASDYTRLGRMLTEIGKRTADLGIPVGYHHHMGSLGEKPEDIERVLDASDPKYVRLLLDIAHYQQGGGDPVAAIRQHHDRLLFLHIKDLQSPVPGKAGAPPDPRSYRFVELGRGSVDLRSVFAALADVGFHGWAVVELDSVPDHARTPKESAEISKRYLTTDLGLRVS